MQRRIDTSDARSFWDEEVQERRRLEWMDVPEIRDYLNGLIGGGRALWPFDWFEEFIGGRTFDRVLSIGCGTGALERDLVRRDLALRVDAFDGSITSLSMARESAAAEKMGERIRYFAADFNEPILQRNVYDAVFFHHSLHHVAKLEKLLRAVMLALRPGGLLYIDEYVGPSRHWWSEERFRPMREMFHRVVPQEARLVPELPTPVVYEDPSEAVRSGEILEQIRVGFDILAERPYGGNILSIVYSAVDWSRAPEGLVSELIEEERRHLRTGVASFLTVAVAQPKESFRKLLASARYFAEPKLKRIAREVLSRK